MAVAGKVFSNMTLRVQNVSSPFQSLLNGMSYYVSVRATNNAAQRLTSVASSTAVKVPASCAHSYCNKLLDYVIIASNFTAAGCHRWIRLRQ